jgi:glycine oxidase
VKLSRGRVAGVQTSRGFVATETLVIANGAWASQLEFLEEFHPDSAGRKSGLDKVSRFPRIEPARGQMLCFEANPPICRHVIYSPRGYIVPRRDGRLLAGSSTENVGFDKRNTARGVFSILSSALEIAPGVASLGWLDVWAGLRPRAADNLPVLGPYAEIEGVFYATGHYRNGILLAPITGELIARAVVDKFISPAVNSFSPNRFDLVFRA